MPRRRSLVRLGRTSRSSSGPGCLLLLLGLLGLWLLVSFSAQLLTLGLIALLLYLGFRLAVWRPKVFLWVGAAFLGLVFVGSLLPEAPPPETAPAALVSPRNTAPDTRSALEPADRLYQLKISATYPNFTVKVFPVVSNRVDYQRVIATETASYMNHVTLQLRPGDYKIKLTMEGYNTVFWFRAFIPKNRNIAVDTRKFKSEFLTRICKQDPNADGSPFGTSCPRPVQVAPRPQPRPTPAQNFSIPRAQPDVYYPNCAARAAAQLQSMLESQATVGSWIVMAMGWPASSAGHHP